MIGTTLQDRYELLEELGRGGMGVVYRARDPRLEREVAVKLVPPLRFDEEAEKRFRREAQVVAGMDHPAIVAIHDYGRHDGALYFVMPLVTGTTLREWISSGNLLLGDVVLLGAQVADALDYSHERGVVHRDVKPENVMIQRERGGLRARVMDFGLARETADSRLTLSGSLVGTPAYLSPEQVTGVEIDHRSDLYSLGAVLYECLAGEPPFAGAMHMVISRIPREPPPPLAERGAEVPPELEGIVLRCLAKEPSERPASGKALAAELMRCWDRLAESERSRALVVNPGRGARGAPFVGRATELAELERRLETAFAGECQLVLLGGEAGIGKSRLVEEVAALARRRGALVLSGHFADRESSAPFQGFCELVQAYFRGDPPAEPPLLSDLAADLVTLFPVLSEISALRDVAVGEPKIASLSAGEAGAGSTYVFELLARTLTRLAAGRPTVLVLENLHRGEMSIEALRYVVRRLGPTPTLIVGTYRRSELEEGHPLRRLLASLGGDPRVAALELGPLEDSDYRQLVETLLETPELHQELVDWLFEATEGNPLFSRELLQSLSESGEIQRDASGSWMRVGRLGPGRYPLPATLRQAVEKRLERLPRPHQQLLSVASVLGKSFEYRDLEALAKEEPGDDPPLDPAIDELVTQGILEEDDRSRSDRLRFSSGILRDVLYAALSRRRRRRLHLRHGRWLERRYEGRLERVYPQLAHHFHEGDAVEETVRYAGLAARQMLDSWSPEEALRISRRALEVVEDGDFGGSSALVGELREVAARASQALGKASGAQRQIERALEAFLEAGDRERAAAVALLAARNAWQSRKVERARRWVDRGVEIARGCGAEPTLRELLVLGATVANLRGDGALAQTYLEEAEKLVPGVEDGGEEPIPEGGCLRLAMPYALQVLEPGEIYTDWETEIAANLYETLIASDSDGHLVPSLAASWQSLLDGCSFLLTLEREARFSDGHRLRARDVKESFERAGRLGGPSPPAAFAVIAGFAEYVRGESERVEGIEAGHDEAGEERVIFHLREPLPIFPALLTDFGTAVTRLAGGEADSSRLLGTGPFVLTELSGERLVLERNESYWRGRPPRLERLEVKMALDPAAIADGLRRGELDLGRDLFPESLDEILRDPRFNAGLVEATKRNVYFALFNCRGAVTRSRKLRRALAGVVRTRDLVWRTLGRFAQPAVSCIPPGILAHDPGRRRPLLSQEQAIELVEQAGLTTPIRLRAAVQPMLQERYRALLDALLDDWAALGVEVAILTPTLEEYAARWRSNGDVDLLIGRWNADYGDPDNFTDYLFHGERGLLRQYFSSPRADRILEHARREPDRRKRQVFYHQFEDLLTAESVYLPLFHEVDYRVANPAVRGLALTNSPPYVNYRELGKSDANPANVSPRLAEGGTLHVPIQSPIETLDPAAATVLEYAEVIPNVFETLTGVGGEARVVPRLAASFQVTLRGRAYHFHLRPRVRFHDGRPLGARDVRYSFERVLKMPREELYLPLLPIRGAEDLRRGRTTELEGFRILSAGEFLIELERPMASFPALLTHPGFSILPEGCQQFQGRWRDGCVGTGPFRVVRFEPGRRLDLERNPHYWRQGLPRSQRLAFHFSLPPEKVAAEFRKGRLALASDLYPADVEALRRDPTFAAGYREAPRLATYFLALNRHHGALRDRDRRQLLAQRIDVEALLRESIGRLVIRAHGILPPGLSGYEPRRGELAPELAETSTAGALRIAVNPAYRSHYASFWDALSAACERLGAPLEIVGGSALEVISLGREGTVDMVAQRWIPDFPDADNVVTGLLHSEEGAVGGLVGSPEIDRLIVQGRRESDPGLRHAIYREIEEILAREALVIPLFYEQTYRFAHPGTRGLRLGLSLPEVRYEELSSEL